MEKQVIICDSCNNRIASHKCAVCGKDLCGGCSFRFKVGGFSRKSISIYSGDNYYPEGKGITKDDILLCEKCSYLTEIKTDEKNEIVGEFKQKIFEILKEMFVEKEI